MKLIANLLVFFTCIEPVFPQSFTATGIVKDEAGNPVPAALVSEFKSKSASGAYTDSLGFFSLPVAAFSKLNIRCKGYNDTLVNIADKKSVVVILSKAKAVRRSADAAVNPDDNPLINKNLVQDAISTQTGVTNSYVYSGGVRNYTGSLLPVFSYKEETKGSRYLFNDWMRGSVINADNSIFNNPAYLYNYDKIGGGLLLTADKQSAIEVDKAQIKSFTVYADRDKPMVYESVPAIDNSHFLQVLSDGSKYKIYKLTKTKFVKSNYRTDGMTSTGNPYDEYIDENAYYVLNVLNKQFQKVSLKKKALKEAFASEGEKPDRFFAEHSQDIINDDFIKSLGDYLNK